jgi:hypothetical protein
VSTGSQPYRVISEELDREGMPEGTWPFPPRAPHPRPTPPAAATALQPDLDEATQLTSNFREQSFPELNYGHGFRKHL